jgi:hypothetical protein
MAWQELLMTPIGLLSLFTIVFVVVIAFFFIHFISDNIARDERRAARKQENAAKGG